MQARLVQTQSVPRRLKAWRGRSASAGLLPTIPGSELESQQAPALQALLQAHREARRAYLPRKYPGRVTLILAREPEVNLHYDSRLPGTLAAGPVEIHTVPGNHGTLLKEPRVRVLATILSGCLDKAIEPRPRPFHDRLGAR